MLATFSTLAPPSSALAARSGLHATASRKADVRLMRNDSSKTAGSHSLGWRAKLAPALLTSTSSPPTPALPSRFPLEGSATERKVPVMSTMAAAVFPKANASLEIVTRDVPEPEPGWVLLRVRACGVCHSDLLVQGGQFPGLMLPRVP